MELQNLNLLPARLVGGALETQDTGGEWTPDTDIEFTLLCSGQADSIGVLFVTPKTNYYITDTQIDLIYVLSKLEELADLVSQTANSNVSFYTEGIPLAPVNPQVVTDVQAFISEIQNYKVT